MLMVGHMDTVFPAQGTAAERPTEADGFTAPASSDMKAGLRCCWRSPWRKRCGRRGLICGCALAFNSD